MGCTHVGMGPKRKSTRGPAGDADGKAKKAKPGQPSNIEKAAKNAIDDKKPQSSRLPPCSAHGASKSCSRRRGQLLVLLRGVLARTEGRLVESEYGSEESDESADP